MRCIVADQLPEECEAPVDPKPPCEAPRPPLDDEVPLPECDDESVPLDPQDDECDDDDPVRLEDVELPDEQGSFGACVADMPAGGRAAQSLRDGVIA
jgi:hypothetical protein